MHEDWTLLKKLIWLRGSLAGGAAPILKTIKGALLHITDALAKPAHELVAVLKPVQDLHGQDAPFPPGGKGNVMPPNATNETKSNNGITIKAENGVYTISGTATAEFSITFPLLDGFTIPTSIGQGGNGCVYFFNTVGLGLNFAFMDGNTQVDTWGLGSANRTHSTYVAMGGRHCDSIKIFGASGLSASLTVSPMFTDDGTTDKTTFALYQNICPISGWTGANIYGTGVNVWDEEWEIGSIYTSTGQNSPSTTAIRSINYISIFPSTKYYAKTANVLGLRYYDANKNYLRAANNVSGEFTTPSDACYLRFAVGVATYSNDISINYPSTDTEYHAYHGQTLPINWQSEAGTIYGGTVTLNEDGSADVVAEWASTVFDGTQSIISASWQPKDNSTAWIYSYDLTNHAFPTVLDTLPDYLASSCPVVTPREAILGASPQALEVSCYTASSIGIIFRTTDMTLTTENAINTYLSENPVQLVYKLATPQIYHFDNIGQLVLFLGENNIWVDASDDLTLTYYADGNVSDEEALNTLLGGMYSPGGDVSDREALDILLGN